MTVRSSLRSGLVIVWAVAAFVPAGAAAQVPAADAWTYRASLYVYLPSLSGSSSVPADGAGTPINVSADKIVDSLQFTLMGSLGAHNGRWGLFTDAIYLDLGGDKSGSRDFTIGNVGLPAGTSADLGWDLKGLVWTVGGEFRLVSGPGLTLDALGGVRLLDVRQTLRWNITGDLGPIAPPGRSGETSNRLKAVDGIVGASGRMSIGQSAWSLPFYVDVGAGQSHLTWQAAAGVSRAFGWGEASLTWRHLAYEMKPGKPITDLKFSGPMFAATFHW